MAGKRPTTIADYIRGAPHEGQPHLRRLYALLKGVAPEAEETIKWGTPFFVEPRFLFAFSAHKAHLDFAPMASGLAPFRKELAKHRTTRNFLQIPYDQPLPESLIRRIAKHRLREVRKRKDDAFW
ncbi:MAG: iron chaperone [Burkholderiales bacterium]